MTGRKLQLAAGVLIFSMALAACTGCGAEDKDSLETLYLEDGSHDKEEAMQEHSDEEMTSDGAEENKKTGASGIQGSGDAVREEKKQIFVYVCGAVRSPGVYGLEEGARLYEAIACAGGVREDAAEESVNQAQAVVDGERLYIPTDEEIRQGLDAFLTSGISIGDGSSVIQENGSLSGGSGAGISRDGSSISSDGKVNINIASREELKTLNGIGDTRAESILSYREQNGPFQTIEDLMKVDGIKEGVFNKMKDSITVN